MPRAWRSPCVLLVLALSACSESTDPPDDGPVFSSVSVAPGSSTLVSAGQTVQLQATALDQSGNPISGKAFAWASSDESVATVTPSGGLVTSTGTNGTATITASSEGKSGSATVESVTSPAGGTVSAVDGQVTLDVPAGAVAQPITVVVSSVSSPPPSATLVPGTAFDFGPDGTQFSVPVRLTIEYDVANLPPDVPEDELRLHKLVGDEWVEVVGGTVDTSTKTVTGLIESFSVYACLALQVDTVEVVPAEAEVLVGETVQLEASLRNVHGVALEDRPVAWTSGNEDVATIDEFGLVTGIAIGSVVVTATSQGEKSGSASITVLGRVATVDVSPSEATISVGDDVQLIAEPRDSEGNVVEGAAVEWSTSDDAVATVDQSGLVAGASGGEVTVTATSEGATGESVILVLVPVAAVDVSPAVADISEGDIVELTATPRDSEGNALDRPVTWSSSDDQIASVDDQGTVTGESEGTVTLTASSEGVDGMAEVTVSPPDVATVDVTPPTATIDVGQTIQLTATPRDADGAPLQGRATAWTSEDDLIAEVDQSGLVTGVAAGAVTITATSERVDGLAQVTVRTPGDATMVCGDLVSGEISAAAEVDLHRFVGSAGTVVSLTLVETSNWGGVQGSTDARGTLLSPSGGQLEVFDSNAQIIVTLPEDGTYTLRVNANNLVQVGTYNLGLECISPTSPVDGTLTAGDVLGGSIAEAGQINQYTFEASDADVITLTLIETSTWGGVQGSTDARGVLYTPSGATTGTSLASFDSNTQQTFTLDETGTYVVRIYPNNLVQTGDYNLGLERISPTSPVDGTLTAGDVLGGSIAEAGQINQYTFEASDADVITLTLVETSTWGGVQGSTDARGVLYTPSGATTGTSLASFDSNTQQTFTLDETGTYVVRIYPNNLVQTGDYNLGLERISPTPVVDGAVVCGGFRVAALEAGDVERPSRDEIIGVDAEDVVAGLGERADHLHIGIEGVSHGDARRREQPHAGIGRSLDTAPIRRFGDGQVHVLSGGPSHREQIHLAGHVDRAGEHRKVLVHADVM